MLQSFVRLQEISFFSTIEWGFADQPVLAVTRTLKQIVEPHLKCGRVTARLFPHSVAQCQSAR